MQRAVLAAALTWISARAQAEEAVCAGCASGEADEAGLLQAHTHSSAGQATAVRKSLKELEEWWKTTDPARPRLSALQQRADGSAAAGAGAHECKMGAGKSCDLGTLKSDAVVYPGGADHVCFDGSPYAFTVQKGASDKLVFYFDGGGACWKSPVTGMTMEMCSEYKPDPMVSSEGVFDKSSDLNVFRDYTVVKAIYCSGDAFMGTTEDMFDTRKVHFKGYHNARAVVDWVQENFPDKLSSLVIMGQSAGSLGTHVWSQELLSLLKYDNAQVLLDSYAGLFPHGTQAQTIKSWGGCPDSIFTPEERKECEDGTLTVQRKLLSTMKANPTVTFASLQSKWDGTQQQFYSAMAQSNGLLNDLTWEKFQYECNGIFEQYNKEPNYVLMTVNSEQHVFTCNSLYDVATAGGISGEGGEPLHQWVKELVRSDAPASTCEGPLGANEIQEEDFCDEALLPKVSDAKR